MLSRERSEQRVSGLSAKGGKRGTPCISLPKAEEGSLSAMPMGTLSVREPVRRGSRWAEGKARCARWMMNGPRVVRSSDLSKVRYAAFLCEIAWFPNVDYLLYFLKINKIPGRPKLNIPVG